MPLDSNALFLAIPLKSTIIVIYRPIITFARGLRKGELLQPSNRRGIQPVELPTTRKHDESILHHDGLMKTQIIMIQTASQGH
jgi:hypothetical protein